MTAVSVCIGVVSWWVVGKSGGWVGFDNAAEKRSGGIRAAVADKEELDLRVLDDGLEETLQVGPTVDSEVLPAVAGDPRVLRVIDDVLERELEHADGHRELAESFEFAEEPGLAEEVLGQLPRAALPLD